MPERFSLGAVIRQRRRELGWTQEELAERISTDDEYVRQSEISRIENGRVELPRIERLMRLAEVLELPPGELLARSGWAGADALLPDGKSTATATPPGQPVHRPDLEFPTNGEPAQYDDLGNRPMETTTSNTAIENLRRALASLHEQTDRLNRNRDRAAEILERVQRPCAEPGSRRFLI